jgi:hypothetical protein
MSISYPPIFINEYIKEKISETLELEFPILTTGPFDINSVTEGFPDSEGIFAVYDRMFKMRRSPFPHIKSEQLLYYFYKMSGTPNKLIEALQRIQDLLDRGDESAQEINEWLQARQKTNPITDDEGISFKTIFFHSIKIYQLEETRDIIDFGTARTIAGNKIIIDYDYHVRDYS